MAAIRLGEQPFLSVQGEGNRAGVQSVWIRFFGCSLRCKGFQQPDPTDTTTYFDPLAGVNINKLNSIYDLPIVEFGCDSIYSIDNRFKKFALTYEDAQTLVDDVISPLFYDGNVDWVNPNTQNLVDLCFTGGEPMLQQKHMIEIANKTNFSGTMQIETNGTTKLSDLFVAWYDNNTQAHIQLNFNISPKLFTVSGEPDTNAWKPTIIKEYYEFDPTGCLKFVINNNDCAWKELREKVTHLRNIGVKYPVYIMPVGATKEQQSDAEFISKIANRAVNEGYHISGRLHAILWGNTIGA